MTTVDTADRIRATANRPPEPAALADLRQVVRLDIGVCAASGVALVAGARPLADLAGLAGGGETAAVGGFLLVLAAGLVLLARASARTLVQLVPWSAEGDLAWAAASALVAGTVSMNGTGRALVLAQGVIVAGVGVAKLRAHRAARAAIIGAR